MMKLARCSLPHSCDWGVVDETMQVSIWAELLWDDGRYSKLERLAVFLHQFLQPSAAYLCDGRDFSSVFCSELVTAALQDLGVIDREPQTQPAFKERNLLANNSMPEHYASYEVPGLIGNCIHFGQPIRMVIDKDDNMTEDSCIKTGCCTNYFQEWVSPPVILNHWEDDSIHLSNSSLQYLLANIGSW